MRIIVQSLSVCLSPCQYFSVSARPFLFPVFIDKTEGSVIFRHETFSGNKKRSYFAELEKTLKPPDGSMRLKEFKLAVNKLLGTTEFDDQLEKVGNYNGVQLF